MINRNIFEVALEEKLRILNLHENATKNQYLIKEDTGDESLTIPFKYNFPTGYWSEKGNPKLGSDIDKIFPQITNFIGKNSNSTITIEVQVGESAVTNADNEHGGKTLQKGELASLRAETIKKMLESRLNNLLNQGYFTKIPEIKPIVVPPKHEYTKFKDNPKDPKYLEDQFVNFVLKVDTVCLANVTLSIDYDAATAAKTAHNCDYATFKITANGVTLINQDGKPYADLNNGGLDPKVPSGSYRYNNFFISNDVAKQILSVDPNKIIIKSICLPNPNNKNWDGQLRCHNDVPHVTVKDKSGKPIVPAFWPNTVVSGDGEKILCTLDKCGKLIPTK